jgi:nitrite reductase/ring-hydroxylating ferredoxin subunit
MPQFVPVAKTDEVPEGELRSFEVEDRNVAVCCVDGEYHAFDDICTHRACSLSEGDLDGTEVVCPCHAGVFDVTTGEVLDGPPPEPVGVFRVRVTGDDIEIEI